MEEKTPQIEGRTRLLENTVKLIEHQQPSESGDTSISEDVPDEPNDKESGPNDGP